MISINYARQNINQEDIDAVIKVLKSDFLTQGPSIPIFEELVSNYVGSKYAIAFNRATSALHISCLALGEGKGDYVWTTPITFEASANCAIYCGAEVDFVDIDPKNYNLSAEHLEEKHILAKRMGKLPNVVISVHFAGQPRDTSGGAGNYSHKLDAVMQAGASALVAASIFHFTELTPAGAKLAMDKVGIPMRLNSVA